jgi:DNA repair exonuclease SbcCD ATPase subunit
MYREKLVQLENDYQSAVHYVKGTEKMLKQLKEQLARYKTENARLKSEYDELEEKAQEASSASAAPAEWESERAELQKKVNSLQDEVRSSAAQLERQLGAVQKQLDDAKRERESAVKNSEEAMRRLGLSRRDLEQLQQENSLLERRAMDAEQKVSLLLDQVEHSVDNYRRRSRNVLSMNSELAASANGLGLGHTRNESSEVESLYGGNSNGGAADARNSTALDNLANELETLRTQWESTNKAYRLSNTFDFEPAGGVPGARKDEEVVNVGLSDSLADWRKRLDAEERSGQGRSASEERAGKSKVRPGP